MTKLFRRRRNNNNNNNAATTTSADAAIPPPPPPSDSSGVAAMPTTAAARAIPINNNNNNNNTMICHTCRQPISRNTRHIHTSRKLSGERRYHRPCFLCLHCNAPIDPQSQSFCYAKLAAGGGAAASGNNNNSNNNNDGGEDEHPFHKDCFAHHFGWMCVVCEKPLPMVTKFNNPTAVDGNEGGNAANATSNNNNNNTKSTKVEFLKHPFFDKERMCPHHATGDIADQIKRAQQQQQQNDNNNDNNNNGVVSDSSQQQQRQQHRGSWNTTTTEEVIGEIRRCAGCHRFEPLLASPTKHFIDVGDSNTGRCVCLACCRTVVTSSDDVIPLWDKVIDFFEGPLGLITSEDSMVNDYNDGDNYNSSSNNNSNSSNYNTPAIKTTVGVTRRDLKNIPIMVVGLEALNDNMRRSENGTSHFGSSQIMTRGLCLSEHTGSAGGVGLGGCGDGIGVTAILCLSGLPSDLTASILAHEATHAWIKLHPNFPYTDPLPLKVEEGLSQLVAFLFLNDGLDPIEEHSIHSSSYHSSSTAAATRGGGEKEDESIPSDEKLRQYFRFCIETDEGVYGEGFRLAARAYAKMGIQELLYYVAVHHDFPPL
ncbi:hypothetical protein ACHAXR_004038 [Thalassiosira sp. AJA248-18]